MIMIDLWLIDQFDQSIKVILIVVSIGIDHFNDLIDIVIDAHHSS